MVSAPDVWELIKATWFELSRGYEPVLEMAAKDAGLDLRMWGLLLAVVTFEPEDTTPAHLMVRIPYASPESYYVRLEAAAKQGFLHEIESGKFLLTSKGRDVTMKLVAIAREQMMKLNPLSTDDVVVLSGYLERLVNASLSTPPPPNTWSIQLSCKLMPDVKSTLAYVEQAVSALEAYRDDAHLAAWQQTDLSATSLETLTLLWKGEASSLDKICARLVRRGHSGNVYQNAIDVLRSQGLVGGSVDALWITGSGRVFRNQIEDDTARYFFTPWSCLSEDELRNLHDILLKLNSRLKNANMGYSIS